MKESLLQKIQRETELHSEENPGLIRIKTNALQDRDIIVALYRASQSGVKIELLVRDTCCLRPGIPGISENIRVISIIGRFLEHGRVYHFRNGGNDEYFIGSADCMMRNLESRVETLVPIEDPKLILELDKIITIQVNDRRSAWDMQSDGQYVQRKPNTAVRGSQEIFIDIANKRQKAANQLKRIKSRGKSKKEYWHSY